MITTLLNHRFVTFFLIVFLFTVAHAQEQAATEAEPTTAVETSETETSSTEASTEPEAASTEQAAQEAPKSDTETKGEIVRAQFTTAIVDREPTDDIVMLTNDNDKIYFFTELVGFNGQTVKHRWEYEGKEMAVVDFNVEGQRWRVHSSKNIKPEWTGIWNVTVLDADDNPLKVSSFEVVEASTSTQQ
ncbi:DUF2914 domain-containing protein [Kaarinaea lacus]